MSMFNYVVDNKTELRLYNSLRGTNSLLIIRGKNYEKVKKIIEKEDLEIDLDDNIINKLIQFGFLVDSGVDERLLLEGTLSSIINYPKLHLVIMPTEDCNFRCVYCYEDHKKGKMTLETQNAVLNFVRKNIKYYTGLTVGWFGGEPLEAIDVIKNLSNEFIRICNVARKPYRAGMTTNAYDLTGKVYRELYKLHVYEYQISIDGLKEEHDKTRKFADGTGTFEKIIANIREIINIKDIAASDIVIRTNFTKSIAKRLPEYIQFYDELLQGDPRFSIQINVASDWGGESVKQMSNDLLNIKEYIDLFSQIKQYKNCLIFAFHLQELNPGEFKCYAARKNSYCIGSDAKIYKCTENFNMPENNIGFLSPEGNMHLNEYYTALWANAERITDNSKCQTCNYSGCCLYSPCPLNSIKNVGRQPVCPRTKGNIINLLKLLNEDFFQLLNRSRICIQLLLNHWRKLVYVLMWILKR